MNLNETEQNQPLPPLFLTSPLPCSPSTSAIMDANRRVRIESVSGMDGAKICRLSQLSFNFHLRFQSNESTHFLHSHVPSVQENQPLEIPIFAIAAFPELTQSYRAPCPSMSWTISSYYHFLFHFCPPPSPCLAIANFLISKSSLF